MSRCHVLHVDLDTGARDGLALTVLREEDLELPGAGFAEGLADFLGTSGHNSYLIEWLLSPKGGITITGSVADAYGGTSASRRENGPVGCVSPAGSVQA